MKTLNAISEVNVQSRTKDFYRKNQEDLAKFWANKSSLTSRYAMLRIIHNIATILQGIDSVNVSVFSLEPYYVKNFVGLQYVLQDRQRVQFPAVTSNVVKFRPSKKFLLLTYNPIQSKYLRGEHPMAIKMRLSNEVLEKYVNNLLINNPEKNLSELVLIPAPQAFVGNPDYVKAENFALDMVSTHVQKHIQSIEQKGLVQ